MQFEYIILLSALLFNTIILILTAIHRNNQINTLIKTNSIIDNELKHLYIHFNDNSSTINNINTCIDKNKADIIIINEKIKTLEFRIQRIDTEINELKYLIAAK